MNKKQKLVAKKHRRNKNRLKALNQAAIASGKKTEKKVAHTKEPKAAPKKPAAKKAAPKKPAAKKATPKKTATKKTTAKKSDA